LGRAGTGKTTALGIFASSKEIKAGGVLALTPTGKARVQLENSFKKNSVEAEFMTVAQFLIRSKGFSWNTMAYKMPSQPSSSIAKTVIIDESSMLTEDMFAGILKLVDSHAERIIFIGDPNQLPPIGAGRAFVDLINYLEIEHPDKQR
jgi:ATP-dependent exoDNAse (exonuclease V) alpha subunit